MELKKKLSWNNNINMFEQLVPEALVEMNEQKEELIKKALLLHSGNKVTKKARENISFVLEGNMTHYKWQGKDILSFSNVNVEMMYEKHKPAFIEIHYNYIEHPVESSQFELF